MSRPGPPNVAQSGPVRLRQIALVAKDLKQAERLLTKVLGTEVIYVDPQVGKWGLENILAAIGGDVIEVVSPKQDGTTAGRLLEKRGDGGYMIIMQHPDAQQRRELIEARGLAKVIHYNKYEDGVSVQYHPKGIKGGVIPELDSHTPTKENPTPLTTRFSPWHACGPDTDSYLSAMKKHSHLSLLGVVCRLAPGDGNGEDASTQWENTFGVPRSRDLVAFTNARMGFIRGEEGKPEGMVSISVGVGRGGEIDRILQRAMDRGLRVDPVRRWIEMLGVKWYFSNTGGGGGGEQTQSKI